MNRKTKILLVFLGLVVAGSHAAALFGSPADASAPEAASVEPSSASSQGMADRAVRETIAGVDVIAYPTAVQDVVTIAGALPGGDAFAGNGNIAAPTLAAMMLDRGTTRHDKFAIAAQLENVGASISFRADTQAVEIRARTLSRDLPLVIGLIAEQLRSPALDPAEFEKARQQFIGSLRMATEDVGSRANERFARSVYPEGHPNRPPSSAEYLAAAQTVTLQEVREFHRQHYGPAYLTLVLVGDVDVSQAREAIAGAFGGWQGGVAYLRGVPPPVTPLPGGEQRVMLAEKTSVTVLLGQATGLQAKAPESLALQVGTAILGRGFTGRLMATVRDKEGLTYGIGAGLDDDTFTGGSWRINATFAPALLDKGIVSARKVFGTWWREGVTAQELAARKQGLIGAYRVGLSTTGGIAGAILETVQSGHDLQWLDDYPRAIDALTVEQVNAAIHDYLDPERMVLVAAGTLPQAGDTSPAPAGQAGDAGQ